MYPWIAILIIIVISVIAFSYRKMTFFRDTGVTYQIPIPFLGNMAVVYFQKMHVGDFVTEMYNRFHNVKYFGLFDLNDPVIVIRDPEVIKLVAVKNFESFMDHKTFFNEEVDPLFGRSLFNLKGEKWRKVRQLLSPAFSTSKMKTMSVMVAKCAVKFSEHLARKSARGEEDIQIKDAILRFASDVIAQCSFGLNVDSNEDPTNNLYVLGKRATNFEGFAAIKFFIAKVMPSAVKIFDVKLINKQMAIFFRNIIQRTIETREKENIVRQDMLQLMIDNKSSDVLLTMEEMAAQAFIFFFGGFEVSSGLMAYTVLQLSISTDIQKRLQDEVDSVMKRTNYNPSYETIEEMQYLHAVLYESLRYFSLNPLVERLCTRSFELPPAYPGGRPFTVKPGVNIWFPLGGIHMDPKYYPNPEKYDPDRFLDNKVTLMTSTFLAFGVGPRTCLGKRFGLMESKFFLCHLLARCNLKLSPKVKLPLRLSRKTFAYIPEGGFWVRLEPRNLL